MNAIGLVDCDSFYASCEQLFAPAYRNRPLVVLSSNDGNVIARSAEAKALGIEMGERMSVLRERQRTHEIIALSANFCLYGDLSQRVMQTIHTLVQRMEIYSIDEAFIDAAGDVDLVDLGQQIRSRVAAWVGIPTSIGFGPTKVLAKVATRMAKKNPKHRGVFCFPTAERDQLEVLEKLDLRDVWGIAEGLAGRLNALGISSARGLRDTDPQMIRAALGVVGERLVWELRGQACTPLEEHPQPKKSLTVSRTFGCKVRDRGLASAAIAGYVQLAAEKLRRHGLATSHLHVFMHTSPFDGREIIYAGGQQSFVVPTADTRALLSAARQMIERTFRAGVDYVKGGCLCTELVTSSAKQLDLFTDQIDAERREQLLCAIDKINQRQRGLIGFGAAMNASRTAPRASHRSPRYTTRWDEIPVIG